ncbi:uncharacterized protein SOCE26_082900 [Sorangium cellulosum]|uniref:Uncharacterized protein n=1 Tax=Sorangium cellulosum TaxID=56 RepID=A0A2L0F5K8_SORCE|nr:uncharacterized protein SOCE26_082900 [Sorangium cellulosum]
MLGLGERGLARGGWLNRFIQGAPNERIRAFEGCRVRRARGGPRSLEARGAALVCCCAREGARDQCVVEPPSVPAMPSEEDADAVTDDVQASHVVLWR